MRSIWFWQGIISPHMAGLAVALARRGCDVNYVAERVISADRVAQGWSQPDLVGVALHVAESGARVDTVIAATSEDSVHLCGGLRANGVIGRAQRALARRGLRQWVVMETVDDAGWRGALRRLEYSRLFRRRRSLVEGVLAIGERTATWVEARGVPADRVYPFAYFLPDSGADVGAVRSQIRPFRFLFVGQLIERKRLDMLITCLSALPTLDFRLGVVGSGSLKDELRGLANRVLPGRVDWLGPLPMSMVVDEMVRADCLVLPSRHDGWGAVVSEALMAGTPVICSDTCGAAAVVRAGGQGGVFNSGDGFELTAMLEQALAAGPRSAEARYRLRDWARCLGAEAGADYLLAILDHAEGRRGRPQVPWGGGSTRD